MNYITTFLKKQFIFKNAYDEDFYTKGNTFKKGNYQKPIVLLLNGVNVSYIDILNMFVVYGKLIK